MTQLKIDAENKLQAAKNKRDELKAIVEKATVLIKKINIALVQNPERQKQLQNGKNTAEISLLANQEKLTLIEKEVTDAEQALEDLETAQAANSTDETNKISTDNQEQNYQEQNYQEQPVPTNNHNTAKIVGSLIIGLIAGAVAGYFLLPVFAALLATVASLAVTATAGLVVAAAVGAGSYALMSMFSNTVGGSGAGGKVPVVNQENTETLGTPGTPVTV
jgi:hypothetical protein